MSVKLDLFQIDLWNLGISILQFLLPYEKEVVML